MKKVVIGVLVLALVGVAAAGAIHIRRSLCNGVCPMTGEPIAAHSAERSGFAGLAADGMAADSTSGDARACPSGEAPTCPSAAAEGCPVSGQVRECCEKKQELDCCKAQKECSQCPEATQTECKKPAPVEQP